MTDPTLAQNIRDGSAHASEADIRAILEGRRQAEAQRVADRPISHEQWKTQQPPAVQADRLQAQQAAPEPASEPVPTPVSDSDLTAFLHAHYPALRQAAIELVQPPFKWQEILTLGQAVSEAVHDGLPLVKGQDAANLVQLITGFLFDTYVAPRLPGAVKIFSGLLRGLLIQAIQFAYVAIVKPKAG